MGLEFRLLDENGQETVPLPDVESFSLSPVFCDAGGIDFSYPRDGVNWQSLALLDEVRIGVYVDGIRQKRLDAILQDISGDEIKDDAVWKYAGFFNLGRLNEGIVYPKGWPTVDPLNTKYILSEVTAGTIMRTFLLAAQARGALLDITFSSFSAQTDSNGLPWPTEMSSIEYSPGVGLLDVLKELHEKYDLCEFEMVGTDLRIYKPGTMGDDLTTGIAPVVFRKGRDLSDAPRKTSTRGIATAMLGAGAEGLYHEQMNGTAIATRRRIEGMVSSGQLTDPGALGAYTAASLERVVNGKLEKSHGLNFVEDSTPQPIRDFGLGDWVYSDVGRGNEKLQIKQWLLKLDPKGVLSGSVVLNDLFDAREVELDKTLRNIVGGSTITGASQAVEHVPGELTDEIGPNAPAGLGLTSAAYTTADGQAYAAVTATWAQVTTNSDGTVIDDLAGYTLAWAYESNPTGWQLVDSDGTNTTLTFSSVPVGTPIRAQVRAFDRGGWTSGWSTPIVFHTTASDTTVPEKPSTLVAEAIPGGLLRATFDGKTASGAAWAPSVQQFRIFAGLTSNFVPQTGAGGNHIDTLTGPGSVYLDPGYGQSRYFKVVAVARNQVSGPASDPSTNVTTTKLLGDDIFDGAVGSAQLADAAITNAKIASLAVNDAKIGGLSAAKIETGVMHAEITVSGRIATALSGKRSEMNGIGFQAWNAAGSLTVSIDGENNLLMGVFRTSLTGRRIEMGANGDVGQISFYGPDGRLARIRGFTATLGDPGDESIEMGIPITNKWSGWNAIQVNLDEEIFLQSGYMNLTVGGDGTGSKGLAMRWATSRGTSTAGPVGYDRLRIDATSSQILSSTGAQRLYILDNEVRIFPNGWGSIEVYGGPQTNAGADLAWVNDSRLYSARLRYQYVGDTYAHRFEHLNAQGSASINSLALTHYNLSDMREKTDLRSLEGSMRERMKEVRGKLFKYKSELDEEGNGPDRYGVMAQHLPPELAQPAHDGVLYVSPMAVASAAIEMIHELEDELAELRRELAGKGKK